MPTGGGGNPPPGYSIHFKADGSVDFKYTPYAVGEEHILYVTAANGTVVKIDPYTGSIIPSGFFVGSIR